MDLSRTFKSPILWAAFLIYIAVVIFTACHHEPWVDEAQVWILGRDAGFFDLFFNKIRLTGHTSLWFLILFFPAKAGLPYVTMTIIAAIISATGIAVFLRTSKFPVFLTILFALGYWLLYQYSFIARHYVLFPLILFLMASIYNKKSEHIYLYCFLLILLTHAAVLGVIISFFLFIDFILSIRKATLSDKQFVSILLVIASYFLVIYLGWPPEERAWITYLSLSPGHLTDNLRLLSVSSFAAIYLKTVRAIFMGALWPSAIVFMISLYWFWRQKTVILFLLIFSSLVLFGNFVWLKGWLMGIPFLVWLFFMLISFDANLYKSKTTKNIIIGICAIVAVTQCYWSVVAIQNEMKYPYSAGKELSSYLKKNNLEKNRIFAAGYYPIAALPYFDKNIFANYGEGYNAINHYGLTTRNHYTINEIIEFNPDIIILTKRYNRPNIPGYALIKTFKGKLVFKDSLFEENDITLYKKLH